MKHFLYLQCFLLAPSSFYAQSPVASSKITFSVPRDSGVLLLPVFLQYEDIYTDAPLNSALHKGQETGDVFDSLAQRYLRQHGIRSLPADPADSLQGKLIGAVKNLLRPIVPSNIRQVLTAATEAAGCHYVLVCAVRVKVGPGGYWDPNSGAIGSSSSYARFHAALIDPYSADGKPRWIQDVEIRKLPRPQTDRFTEAVQMLFQLLK